MARKKVVFVIVEGPSDEVALGAVLSKLFDINSVFVHIMFGDITTEWLKGNKSIVDRVGDEIKSFAKSRHFNKSDFQEIIHIADTDGAFISNDKIIEDTNAEEVWYSEHEIRTRRKSSIEQRNEIKSRHMRILFGRKTIWDIPYRLYYMSCNLDHVLYNKLNSSDVEKEDDAYQFAKQYKSAPDAFLKYICESDFSVMTGYASGYSGDSRRCRRASVQVQSRIPRRSG